MILNFSELRVYFQRRLRGAVYGTFSAAVHPAKKLHTKLRGTWADPQLSLFFNLLHRLAEAALLDSPRLAPAQHVHQSVGTRATTAHDCFVSRPGPRGKKKERRVTVRGATRLTTTRKTFDLRLCSGRLLITVEPH